MIKLLLHRRPSLRRSTVLCSDVGVSKASSLHILADRSGAVRSLD